MNGRGREWRRARYGVGRAVSATSAVGAFLAFGMAPLASAPPAHADDFGLGDILAGLAGGVDASDAAASVDPGALASVLDGAAGDNFLFDIINLPTQFLFGVNLLGDGVSIGDSYGLLGETWSGENTAVLGFLAFGWNVGDGGLLFGNGGDAAELTSTAGVYDGGNAFLFGAGGAGGTGVAASQDADTGVVTDATDGGNGGNGGLLWGDGGAGGTGGTGSGGFGTAFGGDGGTGGTGGHGGPGGVLGGSGGSGGDGGDGTVTSGAAGVTIGGQGGGGGTGGQVGPTGDGSGGAGGNGGDITDGGHGLPGADGGPGGADGTPGAPGQDG